MHMRSLVTKCSHIFGVAKHSYFAMRFAACCFLLQSKMAHDKMCCGLNIVSSKILSAEHTVGKIRCGKNVLSQNIP